MVCHKLHTPLCYKGSVCVELTTYTVRTLYMTASLKPYTGGREGLTTDVKMAEKNILQFVPFASRLEAGFWHKLSQRKLEKYMLSEDARDIHGYYTNSESTDVVSMSGRGLHAHKAELKEKGWTRLLTAHPHVKKHDGKQEIYLELP